MLATIRPLCLTANTNLHTTQNSLFGSSNFSGRLKTHSRINCIEFDSLKIIQRAQPIRENTVVIYLVARLIYWVGIDSATQKKKFVEIH